MLSAVITALLFVVMLLIVASFVIGALREHQRHLQSQAAQKVNSSQFKAPTNPPGTGDGDIAVSGWVGRRFREVAFPFPYFFTNLLVQA